MGAAFLGPLELCISNMRHAAGHRITCCSRWDVFLRQRDAHVLTVSGEWLGANALEFVGFLLVKRPAELEAVWPRAPVARVYIRSLAGQGWMKI